MPRLYEQQCSTNQTKKNHVTKNCLERWYNSMYEVIKDSDLQHTIVEWREILHCFRTDKKAIINNISDIFSSCYNDIEGMHDTEKEKGTVKIGGQILGLQYHSNSGMPSTWFSLSGFVTLYDHNLWYVLYNEYQGGLCYECCGGILSKRWDALRQ